MKTKVKVPKMDKEEQSENAYPPDHKLGMVVTKGGSMCANCEYVNGNKCTNEYFRKWKGNNIIPAPTDSYCCDLWMPDDDDEKNESE